VKWLASLWCGWFHFRSWRLAAFTRTGMTALYVCRRCGRRWLLHRLGHLMPYTEEARRFFDGDPDVEALSEIPEAFLRPWRP
jgi:hypothetical protein